MPIDVDIGIRLVVSGWHFAFLGWYECFNALPPGCSRVPVAVIWEVVTMWLARLV
jgi:hypothetical protein